MVLIYDLQKLTSFEIEMRLKMYPGKSFPIFFPSPVLSSSEFAVPSVVKHCPWMGSACFRSPTEAICLPRTLGTSPKASGFYLADVMKCPAIDRGQHPFVENPQAFLCLKNAVNKKTTKLAP